MNNWIKDATKRMTEVLKKPKSQPKKSQRPKDKQVDDMKLRKVGK